MSDFNKFPSIESFGHVYKRQQYFDNPVTVHYGAKIKLHGTNAAVRLGADGTVTAQSRSRDLTLDDDNAGFARWVKSNEDAWLMPSSARTRELVGDVTYFGEWAGKGIQRGDAVTKLDDKYFFVFAVENAGDYVTDPAAIEKTIPDLDNIVVLPWDMVFETAVDFTDAEACQSFADLLNEKVVEVGKEDPFISGIFGVEGPGEGWVVSPVCDPGEDPRQRQHVARDWYSSLTFKVKTENHAVKTGKPAATKIEIPEEVIEFAAMFVTPARCEQALTEACDGIAEPERTGAFLKWINEDVMKESVVELAESGLTWKDVGRNVTLNAKAWFTTQCQKIV